MTTYKERRERDVSVVDLRPETNLICECPDCGYEVWYVVVDSIAGDMSKLVCGNEECEYEVELMEFKRGD